MGNVRRRVLTALNAVALPIISNPVVMRWFGVMVCEIRYTGRRSGRNVHLTAWWHPGPEGGRIDVAAPADKTWWRNFRGSGGPIEITLDGTTRVGTARAVRDEAGRVRVEVTFDG